MKQPVLRLLCAALLMLLTLFASLGMLGTAVAQEDTPPTETEGAQVCAVPLSSVWVRMVIISSSSEVRLCRPDGALLQTLCPNSDGQCATDFLEPGEYLAVSADSRVAFRLNENASITVLSGNGWSDGELLYLSGKHNAVIVITRTLEASEVTAASDWLIFTLEGCGIRRRQVLRSGEAGSYTVTFYGLAAGSYTVYENDIVRARIILPDNSATATLSLTAHEALLTAEDASSDG